ncbi:kinase-like domain-containing protein [Diplogelasinospora grovesii]|uniref:Kinase-like domain-containing protein n=1 Tax=Diplogelasinospora grovesii TaxID=303347 RepID=A0AAN6N8R2_9PEZI|nr:kinase-like domain-containing protein [Diplogelasinospora grovesii]
MAPKITSWADISYLVEYFGGDPMEFHATRFAFIEEDDVVWIGELPVRKKKASMEEYDAALVRLLDAEIYPEFPGGGELTVAPGNELPVASNLYLKRPLAVKRYNEFKQADLLHFPRDILLQEAHTLEAICRHHPHPNIIGYHGCRVHRGFITGLVLDRHPSDLQEYFHDEHWWGQTRPPLDKERFMEALQSAVDHLHSLGFAHNDIKPQNILVNAAGMPVLVDFDSCRPVGEKGSRGTVGWMDDEENYEISDFRHDTFAMEKLRAWLAEQKTGPRPAFIYPPM